MTRASTRRVRLPCPDPRAHAGTLSVAGGAPNLRLPRAGSGTTTTLADAQPGNPAVVEGPAAHGPSCVADEVRAQTVRCGRGEVGAAGERAATLLESAPSERAHAVAAAVRACLLRASLTPTSANTRAATATRQSSIRPKP